jgi:hypothetical protein
MPTMRPDHVHVRALGRGHGHVADDVSERPLARPGMSPSRFLPERTRSHLLPFTDGQLLALALPGLLGVEGTRRFPETTLGSQPMPSGTQIVDNDDTYRRTAAIGQCSTDPYCSVSTAKDRSICPISLDEGGL